MATQGRPVFVVLKKIFGAFLDMARPSVVVSVGYYGGLVRRGVQIARELV